jgi:hypothetical protein
MVMITTKLVTMAPETATPAMDDLRRWRYSPEHS